MKKLVTVSRHAASQFLHCFDVKDIKPATLYIGMLCAAYGASRLHDGLGFIIFGGLLVLSVKPLRRWW